MSNTYLFLTGVFLFGLLIGSFLNVVIYRVPVMLEREWRCQCEDLLGMSSEPQNPSRFNLAWPPSQCPSCERRITALENIPVLSYLVLRGKCRNCGTRISLRYPAVELLTAIAFVLIAAHFGPTFQALTGLLFTALLIVLTFIDLDHQLLPDNITLLLLWCGLLFSVWGLHTVPVDAILGAVLGYLSLWAVFHGFKLLTGKEGMGYGDFKLLAALGAWMGWQSLPLIIILSSLVGALIGIATLGLGLLKREEPIPFGPFLASAGFIAFLWRQDITDAYFRYLGMT